MTTTCFTANILVTLKYSISASTGSYKAEMARTYTSSTEGGNEEQRLLLFSFLASSLLSRTKLLSTRLATMAAIMLHVTWPKILESEGDHNVFNNMTTC